MVGRFDHVQIVFDDDDRMSAVNKTIETQVVQSDGDQ